MATLEELRRVPLFDGLTEGQLRETLERGSEKFVPAGEINGREGEPVEHLYVILEGELRITKRADGGEVVINTYGPSTFFAEVPLLAGTPFLATRRALSDCRMFLLPEESFRRMLTIYPSFSHTVLQTMAQRVQILQSVAGQRERLNSLSTVAAGLAHELNNPAAAGRRAAEDLRGSIEKTKNLAAKLGRLMEPEQFESLLEIEAEAAASGAAPTLPDPLARSDREDEISVWLEDQDVEDGWELAPTFAGTGLDAGWLETVAEAVPPDTLADALAYLEAGLSTIGLLAETEHSAARISELVEAMKSYSNMDRAPLQEVDVNEGLENTLTVLGYKLGTGVAITRDYNPNLPRIVPYEGELTQVWTSLIDNAIDAVNEAEHIRLRTTCEGDRVLVEVADNGPGIPDELQARVFEPFFTTKEVGAGTGLGLDVSYHIVVGHHGGDICLISRPGDTRFQVRLPTSMPTGQEASTGDERYAEAARERSTR